MNTVGFPGNKVTAVGFQTGVPGLELGKGDGEAGFNQGAIVAFGDGVPFVALTCCA